MHSGPGSLASATLLLFSSSKAKKQAVQTAVLGVPRSTRRLELYGAPIDNRDDANMLTSVSVEERTQGLAGVGSFGPRVLAASRSPPLPPPPPPPPRGRRYTPHPALLITSRLCSTTNTVLPSDT